MKEFNYRILKDQGAELYGVVFYRGTWSNSLPKSAEATCLNFKTQDQATKHAEEYCAAANKIVVEIEKLEQQERVLIQGMSENCTLEEISF